MKKQWFIVQTRGGYEAKAKLAIEEAVKTEKLESSIGKILIPTEQFVDLKEGGKKHIERRMFPGYILINMTLDESSLLLIKNTNNVIGFPGAKTGTPMPISQKEVDSVLAVVTEGKDKPKPKTLYKPGEEILIIDGPFKDFNGSINSVDYDKNSLKIEVVIFERATSVNLDFSQVSKT